MNPCETIQRELKAYLDGQLPFMLRQRVRRHLTACAACREELSAMEQISTELHADTPHLLDASLRARILNAVTSEAASIPASPTPARPSWQQRKPLLLWGGVATALVAWLTLYPLLHGDLTSSLMDQSQKAANTGSASNQEAPKSISAAPAAASPGAQAGAGEVYPAPALPAVAGGAKAVARQEKRVMQIAAPTGAPATKMSLQERSTSRPAASRIAGGGFYADSSVHAPAAAAKAPQSQVKLYVAQRSPAPVHALAAIEEPKKIASGRATRGRAQAALSDLEAQAQVERQVHREATLSVQVDNVEVKSETVTQYVQTAGGFVASNELNTGDDNLKTASLSLKVPVAQFERVLGQVTHLGEVKAKNVTGEDLTEQISDQQQSEHILRQDIDTTQGELAQRLSKVGRQERLDTLRELRTRSAQAQARLQLLRKLGALSTITLELTEKPHSVPPAPKQGGSGSGFIGDMNDTLHAAGQSMLHAARLPILTFIWILAYSPLWMLLIVGYRYAVRR